MDEDRYLALAFALRARLYHVARAMLASDQDAADAVQEALLKGWRRRRGLRDEARFDAWLMRILVNQCRDELRRRRRSWALLRSVAEGERLRAQPSPSWDALGALGELPEEQRLPLLLHYVEGYPMRDVAQILNLRPELARSRLRAGREKLRAMLEREGGRSK